MAATETTLIRLHYSLIVSVYFGVELQLYSIFNPCS